ncbi:MAG: hypothetical protein GWP14_06510 [Actinobacteria bacterium]|nr:hypothetical protein [Actinomycetota bacterium]
MHARYILILGLVISISVCSSVSFAQGLESKRIADAFDNAIHYLRIARWDLAKSNLEYVSLNGDPVEVLALSGKLDDSEKTLLGALAVKEVAAAAHEVLQVLERGRAAQEKNPELIEQEIVRLGTTPRGRLLARDRICDIYKEYAVPQLLRALADDKRADLHANILWVLSEMGKSAVNPLAAGLATDDPVLKRHIVRVLGKLGYQHAAPYLREVIEDPSARPEVRAEAETALASLRGLNAPANTNAADLFYRLANDYYYGKISRVAQAGIDTANVWYFKADIGPTFAPVPATVYNEIMAMRSCQRALELDSGLERAVSLWLSAALQMEGKLAQGQKVALLGKNWPGAKWFVDTAGQRYLQDVLDRAEQDGNAAVALGAVEGLDLTAGRAWLTDASRIIPLAKALRFPDRRVRIAAAFALARAFPEEKFLGAEAVVPTLCEAIRQTGKPRTVIVDASSDVANALQDQLRSLGYDTQTASSWADGLELARASRGPDLLVVGKDAQDPNLAELMDRLAQDYALASIAVVVLADEASVAPALDLAAQNSYLQVLDAGASGQAVAAAHKEVLIAINQRPILKAEADRLALRAAELFVQVASRDGKIFDTAAAGETLIAALRDPRTDLVKLALQGLSLIPYSVNQQAIADYALDNRIAMELRLVALDRLGESARLWGNQLTEEQIASLMKEVLEGKPSEFHSKAARVVGTLNLPSEIIKKLVLREKY